MKQRLFPNMHVHEAMLIEDEVIHMILFASLELAKFFQARKDGLMFPQSRAKEPL